MVGVGLGISFVGYTLIYYGLTQVRGGNWGLFDLVFPSRWTTQTANTPMDNGSTLSGGVVAPTKAQSTIDGVTHKGDAIITHIAGKGGKILSVPFVQVVP